MARCADKRRPCPPTCPSLPDHPNVWTWPKVVQQIHVATTTHKKACSENVRGGSGGPSQVFGLRIERLKRHDAFPATV